MMLGSKDPNYDACGLFRALHSHNPAQYSHIVGYFDPGIIFILSYSSQAYQKNRHILNHPVISKKDMKEYHTTEKYDKVKII